MAKDLHVTKELLDNLAHKPGIKTSEGRYTLALLVFTFVQNSGLVDDIPVALKITQAVLTTLALVGYQVTRTTLKASRA